MGRKRIISLVVALIVLITCFAGCAKTNNKISETQIPEAEIKDYNEIFSVINTLAKQERDLLRGGIMYSNDAKAAAIPEAALDGMTSGEPSESHSKTNTQVNGVDEGDIIKNDGKYIYFLNWEEGKVIIVDGIDMKQVSEIKVNNENSFTSEIYITENSDKLITISSQYGFYGYGNYDMWYHNWGKTTITVYDISDKTNPKNVKKLVQDGSLISSRLIGDDVYVISQYYVEPDNIKEKEPDTFVPCFENNGDKKVIAPDDLFVMPEPSLSYVVAGSINIENPDGFTSTKAILGGGSNIYMNTETLIVSSYEYNEENSKTGLKLFDVKDGKLEYKATAKVNGDILNQFSIDEYKGYVRVVTTTYKYIQDAEASMEEIMSNSLYVLDKNTLEVVGSIEDIAKGERVYSVRFDGDTGYFVTFRQVDPLFAVDLKDAKNPKVLSALKIPGFSSYMHIYSENRLFGIGLDADEETGRTGDIKLSMFSTENKADVKEISKKILKGYSYSESLYDHKAILVDTDKKLIAFAAYKYSDYSVQNSYLIFTYSDEKGFELVKEIPFGDDWSYYNTRGLYMGNYFYTVSTNGVQQFDMNDGYKFVAEIKFERTETEPIAETEPMTIEDEMATFNDGTGYGEVAINENGTPEDFFVEGDDIYILDKQNNKIVISSGQEIKGEISLAILNNYVDNGNAEPMLFSKISDDFIIYENVTKKVYRINADGSEVKSVVDLPEDIDGEYLIGFVKNEHGIALMEKENFKIYYFNEDTNEFMRSTFDDEIKVEVNQTQNIIKKGDKEWVIDVSDNSEKFELYFIDNDNNLYVVAENLEYIKKFDENSDLVGYENIYNAGWSLSSVKMINNEIYYMNGFMGESLSVFHLDFDDAVVHFVY